MSEFNIPFTTAGNYTYLTESIIVGAGSASLSASITTGTSRISSSYSIQFKDDYLQFPSNYTASVSDGVSFMCWVSQSAFADNYYVYAGNNSDGGNDYFRLRLYFQSSTNFRMYTEGGYMHDPNVGVSYDASVSGLAGQWNHFGCIINASQSLMQIYINGTIITNTAYNPAALTKWTAGNVFYLAAGEGASNITQNLLDEWMVIRRALNETEVIEVMSGTFDYTDVDIIHRLSFEKNLNDLSGFGRTMTTSGTPEYKSGSTDVPLPISGSGGGGGSITYPDDNPTIYKTTGNGYTGTAQPLTFLITSGSTNEGTFKFQLSENGTLWQYYNTSSLNWESASIAPVDIDWNTEEIVNNNIHLFNTGSTLYVKTFLESDGSHQTSIDNIKVTFFIGEGGSVEPSSSYYTKNLILTHL